MSSIQTTRVYKEIDDAVAAGYTIISEQGGARSGKTYNTAIWLVIYLMSYPGTLCSVVRASLPALKRSVFRDFQDSMTKMQVWSDSAYNKTEMIYRFPNGSILEFFSADNEQKLRGSRRDVLYCNEANELTQLEWQQLRMRTRRFTIADYNPSFPEGHWLCQVNSDPRTYHFITTYNDNPFLEQTIVDEIESYRYTNSTLWQVYGLGQQAQVEGLIFTNIEVIKEIPHYVTKHHWRGMDFGYSLDPTAIVDVFFHDKCLYLDELCYNTAMPNSSVDMEVLFDREVSQLV